MVGVIFVCVWPGFSLAALALLLLLLINTHSTNNT